MKLKHAKKNSGFTLVELLVVIAIIAILASISTPIVLRKVAQAGATIAQSNSKDIYKGIVEYALKNGQFADVGANANVSMAPYFTTQALQDEEPFYVKGTANTFGTHAEPNGDLTDGLEATTNVFTYYAAATGVGGGWSHSAAPGRAPLLATPQTAAGTTFATMTFGADFAGYGVILNMAGGADRVSLTAVPVPSMRAT